MSPPPFPTLTDKTELEAGTTLAPRFDANGLITCVAQDVATGEILMLAHMNADALARTLETGIAHYWSRSRQKLWRKGEESGNEQRVVEMRIDCDQDAVVIRVEVRGDGVSCHTGRTSCFYRQVPLGSERTPLRPVDDS